MSDPIESPTPDPRYSDETLAFAVRKIGMLCEGKEEGFVELAARLVLAGLARRRLLLAEPLERSDLPEGQQSKGSSCCTECDDFQARVRAQVAEDLRPLITALTAVYDTYLATGGCEPTPEQVKAGMASLVPIEDSHAMEAACDGVLPHLVQLRRFLAETPPAPAESVVAAPPDDALPADFVATFRAAYRAAYDGVAGLADEIAGKGLPGHAAALPDVVGTPDHPEPEESR